MLIFPLQLLSDYWNQEEVRGDTNGVRSHRTGQWEVTKCIEAILMPRLGSILFSECVKHDWSTARKPTWKARCCPSWRFSNYVHMYRTTIFWSPSLWWRLAWDEWPALANTGQFTSCFFPVTVCHIIRLSFRKFSSCNFLFRLNGIQDQVHLQLLLQKCPCVYWM